MALRGGSLMLDLQGIWRSLGLGIIIVVSWRRTMRPTFVVPPALIDPLRHAAKRVVWGFFCFMTVLLPLDIQISQGERLVEIDTQYVAVVLDVSLSMSAKDVEPSRFTVAKRTLDELITALDQPTISVIVFSGIPIVDIPFSQDKQAVRKHLQEMTLADFPPTAEFLGTALGDALLVALEQIELAKAPQASIVLITDGDASEGIDPIEVGTIAMKRGVMIDTLGIGEDTTVLGTDRTGGKIIASMNTETLERLASLTKGSYFRIIDDASTESAIRQLTHKLRNIPDSYLTAEFRSLNTLLLPLVAIFALLILLHHVFSLIKIDHTKGK